MEAGDAFLAASYIIAAAGGVLCGAWMMGATLSGKTRVMVLITGLAFYTIGCLVGYLATNI